MSEFNDYEEIEMARASREQPGLTPNDLSALIVSVRSFRRRVATDGLYVNGYTNLISYTFMQSIEMQLEKLRQEVERERSER